MSYVIKTPNPNPSPQGGRELEQSSEERPCSSLWGREFEQSSEEKLPSPLRGRLSPRLPSPLWGRVGVRGYLIIILSLLIASCTYNYPQDRDDIRREYAGNMFGNKDGITISNNKQTDINLWKKTISVMSEILPLSMVDEKNGLIITDWGNIKKISGNDGLYKVNIVLNGDDMKISVFRQDKIDTAQENERIKNEIKTRIQKSH